jgi:hypothetical protein
MDCPPFHGIIPMIIIVGATGVYPKIKIHEGTVVVAGRERPPCVNSVPINGADYIVVQRDGWLW